MFPFDYSAATIFYLLLYGITLVLHVLPMNYVLAGSTYLAAYGVWEAIRGPVESQRSLAAVLRDVMPIALAVTITAAVAPLLFLQILYQKQFYTANLLLFNRWMAILPVLIIAFYLLYLQKSKLWPKFSSQTRAAVSSGILASFGFVAWSWTENHLLSLRDQATWSAVFASPKWFYHDRELMPRLLVWYAGAFPILALALAWQRHFSDVSNASGPTPADDSEGVEVERSTTRTLAIMAITGLGAAVVSGGGYYWYLESEIRIQLVSWESAPYLAAAIVGIGVQIAGWRRSLGGEKMSRLRLLTISVGALMAVGGATALREVRRVASINLLDHAGLHEAAAKIGGLGVFLVFFAVNFSAIALVVRAVRRGLHENSPR